MIKHKVLSILASKARTMARKHMGEMALIAMATSRP